MKIGLVVPGFSADEQDWCIPALLDLARSLNASDQVHVFALRYPYRRATYRVSGIPVDSLGGAARRGKATLRLWSAALVTILRSHRSGPFDVLHAVYGGEAGFIAVLAARVLRIPCVVSLVGGELVGLADIQYGADLSSRQRFMNQVALRRADAILGGSDSITRLARARVPSARRERVQTLPLGVDTELFSPARSLPRDGARILNVGSLIAVKDQQTLLRAMALFLHAQPEARLTVIGRGVLRDSLGQTAAQLGISPHVQFIDEVRHELLAAWYRRSDLFVQSSRHEGQGLAVLEAAACGTALAGTAVGTLADLAARGAAVAVPPRDPTTLAEAMQQALAARESLAASALALAQQEYGLEPIRERLVALYHSLRLNNAIRIIPSYSRS